ncbi:hypothetical protein [Actinomadura luteofluorescens]|uniref:hypothetical protein n=1 Tax=Actinomadura luteofluorescens TaxID=46163 RepID=UPI0030D50E46
MALAAAAMALAMATLQVVADGQLSSAEPYAVQQKIMLEMLAMLLGYAARSLGQPPEPKV